MASSADASNAHKMIIERDLPITVNDGTILRGDIYRPVSSKDTPCPVLVTYGPYGKGVPWRSGYPMQWDFMTTKHPDMLPGSSREYMVWETPDPEIWTAWGYACLRVDSRGAGRSPGYLDIFSPREAQDFYHCIEWVAKRSWCNGNVGTSGISYFAATQWMVASLQPPSLKAMVPWEGFADYYRDATRHGGIQSNKFFEVWYERQVLSVQYGNPRTMMDPWLGERASGLEELSEDQLRRNRADPMNEILKRPLMGEYYTGRSASWDKVEVPFLSCASWAGYGLHPRGNFEAFTQAKSKQKWLSCHPGRHEEWYYLDQGMALQKHFLDHFLKGEDNGWDKTPPVTMRERRPFDTTFASVRHETSWPLADTQWRKLFLDAATSPALEWTGPPDKSSSVTFSARFNTISFSMILTHDLEITGPLAAKLFASSTTTDMDLFLTLQAFSPDDREVEFEGTVDPHTPLAQGWLRASQRKLDTQKSLPYRPYLTHDETQPLKPGEVYELDVEIWPTHIILPKGFKLVLQIGGKDFERPLPEGSEGSKVAWMARGSGPFLHAHEDDRPKEVFGAETTIWTGGDRSSWLLLPVIEK